MNQLSVFRSSNVARWIDMDLIEREPNPPPEPPRPPEQRTAAALEQPVRPRALRHRPFQRLAQLAVDQRRS
jgi:hypothetical protein